MSTTPSHVRLNTGAEMPLMAVGTLMENLSPDYKKTVSIIETALDVGYRHLDAAKIYNTEKMIGEAIANQIAGGKLKRDDIFVTTKLWRNSFAKETVVPALKQQLQDLRLDYVDLYLIHWPTAFKTGEVLIPKDEDGKLIYESIDYLETWRGMEECYKQGLTKAIGLSNFNSKQITRILENCTVKPANLQIECHPYLNNNKLVEFCQIRGITVMAYAPLAGFNAQYREEQGWPTIYTDDRIKAIAHKHNITPAQVALKYQIQRGVGVAPKSAKQYRMKENFEELTTEDMEAIDKCNSNYRLNAELKDHPYYPFNEEF